jgi:chromosome partitioning protein
MPVITFISPKGGAGKTTGSLTLASQLALKADVTVIDADPNRHIHDWSKGGDVPPRMTIVSDVNEDTIVDKIEEAAQKSTFVVVDMEGTASRIVVHAVSMSDFVIVPTQGSQLDAKEAARALRVISQQEKMVRRTTPGYSLPHAVLLTRTNSTIRTRTLSHVEKSMTESGIPVFKTELNDREAFRAMFSFRKTLEHLDSSQVANIDKAIANARAFAQEVLDTLRKTVPAATAGASK